MPRLHHALIALLAGLGLALAVAACGSEDRSGLLPSSDAQTLLDELESIRAKVDDGSCRALGSDLAQLRGAVVNLPESVAPELRRRLDEGVANLADIAPDECRGQTVTTQEPQETPTPDTQTQTQTQTIETTTTPEPTATPTATPTPTPTPDTGGVEPTEPQATPTPDPGGAGADEVIP